MTKWRPAHQAEPEAKEYEVDVIRPDGRTMYRLEKSPPEAIVVHCADPRFQTAFRRFVTEELGFKNYTPLVIGGGAHSFGMQEFRPKNFKTLWEQVKIFLDLQKVKQVVVINHEDCLWYDRHKGFHPTIPLKEKALSDLKTTSKQLIEDFTGVNIRTFWAALDGDSVYFVEK